MGGTQSPAYSEVSKPVARSMTSAYQSSFQQGSSQEAPRVSLPIAQTPHQRPPVDIEKLKTSFKMWSQGTDLTRTKFNEALSMLEEVGFRRLRGTPLGNRLFDVFDTDKGEQVSEAEFISGMSAILRDDNMNKRFEYTFHAYDEKNSGFVSFEALWYMIENSWRAAFQMLAAKTKDMKYLTALQIDTWSQSQLGRLKSMVIEEFKRLDRNDLGRLDKASFHEWATVDHTVIAQIEGITVEVPVSLVHISAKKIEYPALSF